MKTSFINKTIIILVCVSLVVCSFPMTVRANKSFVLDDLIDTTTNVTEGVTQGVKDAVGAASDAAKDAKDATTKKGAEIASSVRSKFANVSYEDFYSGWEYYSKMVGSTIATSNGQQYVKEVSAAIKNLETSMNSTVSNRGIKQEKGFVAEKWHSETFNIDAVAKGVETRAKQLGETGRASVDVAASTGEKPA